MKHKQAGTKSLEVRDETNLDYRFWVTNGIFKMQFSFFFMCLTLFMHFSHLYCQKV